MKNLCTCGKEKDIRAIQCRSCKDKEPLKKLCKGCNKFFPIGDFNIRPNGKGGTKRRSRCKSCESAETLQRNERMTKQEKTAAQARKRKYEKDNPDKVRRWSLRSTWKLRGFDPDYIEQFVDSHNGLCDICGSPSNGRSRLCIDHKTNKLRGILCSTCNTGIGQFKDNVETLKKAINYLTKEEN